MSATFYSGTDWQDSSGPETIVQVHEPYIWPVDDNSEAAKDALADGLHPVVAIGSRLQADGRANNLTGVVTSFTAGLTTATGLARINIADGMIVRNYIANVLTYSGTTTLTFEATPIPGQAVYVDDSAILPAGVTLSLSPLQGVAGTAVPNPLAGYLWYCEDEYGDAAVGGPNVASTFDGALAEPEAGEVPTIQVYCILLTNAVGLNENQDV